MCEELRGRDRAPARSAAPCVPYPRDARLRLRGLAAVPAVAAVEDGSVKACRVGAGRPRRSTSRNTGNDHRRRRGSTNGLSVLDLHPGVVGTTDEGIHEHPLRFKYNGYPVIELAFGALGWFFIIGRDVACDTMRRLVLDRTERKREMACGRVRANRRDGELD